MKKNFTLLLAAFMLLMVSAQAQSPLTFQWAHSVDGNTTGGDNIIGMCKSSDGNYYVATNFGSSSSQTDAMSVWFDGKKWETVMAYGKVAHTQEQAKMEILYCRKLLKTAL